MPIDDPAYVRPDPLIYDQYFLAAQGFNVTWDNPDFAVFLNGVPASAHELHENTEYDVVVRVWNGSNYCPVVMMPVHLSYLSFGAGTVSHPIGTQLVDVGVKGTATNPNFARFVWRTPPTPGHYCLQALLDPVADEEFGNNLGQHNTDVVETHSPGTFVFSLRNSITAQRQFTFDVDTYALGPIGPCTDDPADRERQQAYHRDGHPLPAGWAVDIVPPSPLLDVLEEIPVTVTVTPLGGWTGTQTINVHTYFLDGGGIQRPAGGVTVTVTASRGAVMGDPYNQYMTRVPSTQWQSMKAYIAWVTVPLTAVFSPMMVATRGASLSLHWPSRRQVWSRAATGG